MPIICLLILVQEFRTSKRDFHETFSAFKLIDLFYLSTMISKLIKKVFSESKFSVLAQRNLNSNNKIIS